MFICIKVTLPIRFIPSMLSVSVMDFSGFSGNLNKSFTSQMIIKNWLALNDHNKTFVDRGMVLTVGDGIAVIYGLFNKLLESSFILIILLFCNLDSAQYSKLDATALISSGKSSYACLLLQNEVTTSSPGLTQ